MTYVEAIEQACKIYGLDTHMKEIPFKNRTYTFAEKIADSYTVLKKPYYVKNSYMHLDKFDFCFFYTGEEVAYSISGVASGSDRTEIVKAIEKANAVCIYANRLLKKDVVE